MLATLCLLICLHHVCSFSLDGKAVKGAIKLQNPSDVREKLKDGSCLNVALKDSTDFTTADTEIGSSSDEDAVKLFKQGEALRYKMNFPDVELSPSKKYSVSAVLNVGWCKGTAGKIDSGEWIRDQDYLTDTKFFLDDIEGCRKEDSLECVGPTLSLIKYEKDEGQKDGKEDDDENEKKKGDKSDKEKKQTTSEENENENEDKDQKERKKEKDSSNDDGNDDKKSDKGD